ncbi:SWIM zinc finger family protein [Actinocorallia longicatena]|uniref:SWIM zinc finger family protein n=1 Tax=Actinocorallia longicatena TaxID=111803 RepID=UPI0031DF0C3F
MSEPRDSKGPVRERRVDDGVEELARWLRDQVAQGLAAAERAPVSVWDEASRRLVNAQAPALAGQVRSLAAVPRSGERWPARLLEEYGLLHLLVRAHQRRSALPEPLRATIRSRVGFTVAKDEVLARARIRDRWYVAAVHDEPQDGLTARRVWLRGLGTGRPALVLSFAAAGRPLDGSFTVGTAFDADLAFYPGAQPLRALVAERHAAPEPAEPPGTSIAELLDSYATALSRDPWLDRWPALLAGVRLARAEGSLHLTDSSGAALPLTTADPWRLLAVSGGAPVTIAAEWTPTGLTPLTAWHPVEGHVPLR